MTVFDNAIADMISIKRIHPVVTELFIRGRKLNISLVFITQPYFIVPKDLILNTKHFFIMKIPDKQELQQTTINHLLMLNSRKLKGFTETVPHTHIHYCSLILLSHHMIHHVFERICWKKYIE